MIYGNITKDPELKSLPSGIQVCGFSVATNRVWKDKDGKKNEDVDYHNIVVFGRQAETVAQYMRKGSSIFVEGRLQTRSWDKADGSKAYRTEIVAERTQFGPRKQGSDTPPETQESAQNDPVEPTGDTGNADISDVPF